MSERRIINTPDKEVRGNVAKPSKPDAPPKLETPPTPPPKKEK